MDPLKRIEAEVRIAEHISALVADVESGNMGTIDALNRLYSYLISMFDVPKLTEAQYGMVRELLSE